MSGGCSIYKGRETQQKTLRREPRVSSTLRCGQFETNSASGWLAATATGRCPPRRGGGMLFFLDNGRREARVCGWHRGSTVQFCTARPATPRSKAHPNRQEGRHPGGTTQQPVTTTAAIPGQRGGRPAANLRGRQRLPYQPPRRHEARPRPSRENPADQGPNRDGSVPH